MAYRELLRRWHQAALAADGGDWDAALETLCGIEEPPARICFNVGCVHLRAGRLRDALRVRAARGRPRRGGGLVLLSSPHV